MSANILSLDLATRICGVVVGDGSAMPAVGAWAYDQCGADLGRLLESFDGDLERLAARHGEPNVVIYEAPVLARQNTLLFMRKVHGMGAYLELWSKRRGAICQEASPSALKKRLTGDHTAKKKDMVAVAQRLGVPLPKGVAAEDAADALAGWLIGLTHHGDKAALAKWDQALYGRRGMLL